MQFSNHTDTNGTLFSLSIPEQNLSARIHISTELTDSPVFSEAIGRLNSETLAATKKITTILENYTAKGFAEKIQGELAGIASATVNLKRVALSQIDHLATKRAEMLKPKNPQSMERLAEIRQWAKGKKPHEIVAVAVRVPEVAEAVLDFPLLLDLPADLIARIENSFIRANIASRYIAQTNSAATPENPLANGTDMTQAMAYAEKALQIHEARVAEISHVSSVIQHTVNFYALAATMTRAEAFKAIGLAN